MMRKSLVLWLFCLCLGASAQQLSRYEYWFDHAIDQRVVVVTANGDIMLTADGSALATGVHSFNFRAQDTEGRWSSPLTSYFLRIPSGDAAWTYEYWFDGKHQQRVAAQGTGDEVNLMIDTKTLSVGTHSLTFRAKDEAGRLSSPMTAYFMRMQIGDAAWTYEYWFDDDHQHRVTGEGAGDLLELELSAQSLTPGIHSFNFRAQDEAGRWSIPVTSYFMRLPNSNDPQATYAYEYWMDEAVDQKVSGTSADGLIMLQVDALSLTAGLHRFAFRVCDDKGNWSSPIYQYFVKPYANVQNLVSGYYYWFNGHVEDAQLVRLSEPSSPLLLEVDLPTNNLEQEVTRENITMLSTDDDQQLLAIKNVLNMQFVDQRGKWSEVIVDTFATAVGDRVVSLTSFIVNPEADEQWKGWTIEGNNTRSIQKVSPWNGDSNNNYFCLHDKNINGWHALMKQTIEGLPAGTYYLSAVGRSETNTVMSLVVNGFSESFPAVGAVGGELWEEAEENSPVHQTNGGNGSGWSKRTVEFSTNGEPFDIVVDIVATGYNQWADIDGFELTVNGIADKAGTVSLSEVQIASIADLSTWNYPGSLVRLQLEGRYDNLKGRDATIYYSIDNGTPIRLADAVAPGSQFGQEVDCFFRENASPHTISLYGKDTEGVMSERAVLEIGNISRGVTVENLPQTAVYTGEAIEIDDLALRDSRTGQLLTEGEDYTLSYINNVDDGQATIVVEGVYPSYLGRRELHFVIKSYIADNELAVLRTLYEQTSGESQWTRKWNLDKEQVLSDELAGVSVRNRHVTAIQLRGNQVTGQLPDAVFTLPQLQILNLEDNALSGTLNTSTIMPALHTLLLARNGLSSLSGAIPATVETLSLGGQVIDDELALHLSQPGLETQMLQLPNIGLYDHQQQSFTRQADIQLMADGYNSNTLIVLSQRDGQWLVRNDEWGSRVYRQEQGYTLYCRDDMNNRYRLALTYDGGDANMDASVNVQDLSALVLYCLNDYRATFNYGAANLWEDERVNVQDAVCLVNILLEGTPPQTENVRNASRRTEAEDGRAMLTMDGGRLLLASSVPVSAFDIILEGVQPEAVSSQLESQGFVLAKRQQAGGTHLVGYSPVGSVLPVGETVLCTTTQSTNHKPQVKNALLADDHAKAIAVVASGTTDIAEANSSEMHITVADGMIVVMATKEVANVRWTLYSAGGAVIDSGRIDSLPAGVSRIPCNMGRGGMGILRFMADGQQPIVRKISNK